MDPPPQMWAPAHPSHTHHDTHDGMHDKCITLQVAPSGSLSLCTLCNVVVVLLLFKHDRPQQLHAYTAAVGECRVTKF